MKQVIAILNCVLLLWCGCASGQTSKEIESLYGKSESVYSVSEGLWMTPTYDSKGQVCHLRLYRKRVSATTTYLGDNLEVNQVLSYLNRHFPVEMRGHRKEGFGLTDFGGGIALTKLLFENISFVAVSGIRLTGKEFVGESIAFDFPINDFDFEEYKRKEALKTDEQLIREHWLDNIRVLEISWPSRKCL